MSRLVSRLQGMFVAAALAGCTGGVVEITAPSDGLAGEPAPPAHGPEDWPWWRGPGRDGKGDGREVPLEWSETRNVLWRAAVPGRGHSSPIVLGDRIFLTTADEAAEAQSVLAYDRRSGAPLWETPVHRGAFTRKHGKNSHASATPAADGERVFVPFLNGGALWVTALDLDGEIAWQRNAGDFKSMHGYGSSPVLHRSLVIVNGDNDGASFIAALNRRTGDIVWRKSRPDYASYATPVVAAVAGRKQLLLSGGKTIAGYDPESGDLLWRCDHPAEVTACTIAFAGDLVFASGGYPEKELFAIRADGSGDVTATHVRWRTGRGVTYVPSPLFLDGRLYVVSDQGIATCFDAQSGEEVWKERLGGDFSASLVHAAGHFFIPDEKGVCHVFRDDGGFVPVALNDLGDGGFATPVICGGRIYLRTNRHLYAIGE